MRRARHYQSSVATIAAGESARAAAEKMRGEGLGSLVVMSGRKPVGILTDRDLLTRVIAAGRDAESTSSGDVMSAPLASVDAEAPLEEVVKAMSSRGIRRIPVVHRERLEGIVSLDDLLVQLANELDDLATGARRGFQDAQRRARTRALQEVGEGLDDLRQKVEKLGGDTRDLVVRSLDELWERVWGPR